MNMSKGIISDMERTIVKGGKFQQIMGCQITSSYLTRWEETLRTLFRNISLPFQNHLQNNLAFKFQKHHFYHSLLPVPFLTFPPL